MIRSILILFISLVIATMGMSIAWADPAAIITDEDCGIIDGDGNFHITNDTRRIVTNSPNGNVKLVCKINIDPTSSGKAHVISDFACVVWDSNDIPQITYRSHLTISSSGNATLTCQLPS